MSQANATWLKRLFLKNKGIKLLSLVLAVLAWYAISGTVGSHGLGYSIPVVDIGTTTRMLVDIPVSALVRPDQAVSIEVAPARVNVMLTGRSSELQNLRGADIRAVVDCGGMRSSTNCELPVVVTLPVGVDALPAASPPRVRVSLSTPK